MGKRLRLRDHRAPAYMAAESAYDVHRYHDQFGGPRMSWRQSGSAMRDEVPSSRAMNLTATEAEVREACTKHSLPISAIETLLSGGTRVVMMDGEAAAKMRKVFKGKLLTGPVNRLAWSSARA